MFLLQNCNQDLVTLLTSNKSRLHEVVEAIYRNIFNKSLCFFEHEVQTHTTKKKLSNDFFNRQLKVGDCLRLGLAQVSFLLPRFLLSRTQYCVWILLYFCNLDGVWPLVFTNAHELDYHNVHNLFVICTKNLIVVSVIFYLISVLPSVVSRKKTILPNFASIRHTTFILTNRHIPTTPKKQSLPF